MKPALTIEQAVEYCLDILIQAGILPPKSFAPDWETFSRFSRLVHDHFEVPRTTFTPIMRRLLYLLASYCDPKTVVGAGTYVGYTFAWLIGDGRGNRTPTTSIGLDIDPEAVELSRRNAKVLSHGHRLTFLAEDAVSFLRSNQTPIDCLYIDVDAPDGRKNIYVDVLQAAIPSLSHGALILAHDPCVSIFHDAFERYHEFIRNHTRLLSPVILPVDECGLSVARAT